MSAFEPQPAHRDGFVHEALLYAGDREFLAGTSRFLRDGVRAQEPCLVVVSAPKIDRLRSELGSHARDVEFADMADVGTNPARIIPAWQDFVDRNAGTGRQLRGIGEPIWAERPADVLVECQQHEALLNVAFDGAGPFHLMCPYDTTALPPAVLRVAHHTHPAVRGGGGPQPSASYTPAPLVRPFEGALSPAPASALTFRFDASGLGHLRSLVARAGASAGLATEGITDFVLAVNEVATNSVRHGGGGGVARLWLDHDFVFCETVDGGRIEAPLAGRFRPSERADRGRGLWLANRVCELVEIRNSPAGTVVRLRKRRG